MCCSKMPKELEKAAAKVGLKISREETTAMQVGLQRPQQIPVTVAQ